jgi:hypothetical protein
VTGSSHQPHQENWYELRLQGHLDARWSHWLDGMHLTQHSDGTTLLRGPVIDEAALHGLLARIRDIGVPLLSVTRLEGHLPQHTTRHDNPDRRLT